MKKYLSLIIIAFTFQQSVFSQNIGINATGATPNASAMLDVSSTTKGMLIPRMTTVQRSAIAGPAEGLQVYDTDLKSFLYLVNTTLDFSDGLNGKGFYFSNPNASRTCGCGESFSV